MHYAALNRAASLENRGSFLKSPMFVGFSYHSRSFLKTEFDETADAKNAVARRPGDSGR
jgi:hypothetical protein